MRTYLDREPGKSVPPSTGQAVEKALNELTPGAGLVLARIRQLIPGQTSPIGNRASLIREQRDAVALGLEIAGMDSKVLLKDANGAAGNLDNGDMPFLRRWKLGVSEAAILRHDSTSFDEWLTDEAAHFDTVTFRDPHDPARKVTVVYADKEDLEKQTGTDLLYYRHHRPGFILIQYKRMRASPNGSTYYPDDQLNTEISRFRKIPTAAPAAAVDEWRLTDDAYFIKLVRDDLVKRTENRLVRGMYLPLGLVDLLLLESKAGRRRKGWSTKWLDTYLSNEEFLLLAKQGYIGTRGATTEHLKLLMLGSFEHGRGVVLTVDETDHQRAIPLRHG